MSLLELSLRQTRRLDREHLAAMKAVASNNFMDLQIDGEDYGIEPLEGGQRERAVIVAATLEAIADTQPVLHFGE